MSCKSEVGDFLGGFCQPSKAGERTSQMARNTRLLDFFFFLSFFGDWLEEVFVKLKSWCIEGFVEHIVSGWGLGMILSPCVSVQTPSGKPLAHWSLPFPSPQRAVG